MSSWCSDDSKPPKGKPICCPENERALRDPVESRPAGNLLNFKPHDSKSRSTLHNTTSIQRSDIRSLVEVCRGQLVCFTIAFC